MIRAANCNRELRTAFLNRLQLSLGQPFWTDFSSLLNSLSDRDFSQRLDSLSDTDFSSLLDSFSEQTSAIDLTVFLNRLQLSLEQSIWQRFQPSLGQSIWHRLQLSLGQPFWTDFSRRFDSLSEQNSAVVWQSCCPFLSRAVRTLDCCDIFSLTGKKMRSSKSSKNLPTLASSAVYRVTRLGFFENLTSAGAPHFVA